MSQNRKTKPARPESRDRGRPRKGDAPFVSWQEVDRLLVFGEKVVDEAGGHEDVRYPSFREVAQRFGVSKSLIGQYADKHNCMNRREENRAREQIQFEQELVKKRAKSRALSTDDELRIIDDYLRGFEQAVKEDRVRYDNPADFNTMVRLKEFKQGRADSRQEVHGLISLEEIQARHKALQARLSAQEPALAGRIEDNEPRRETADTGEAVANDRPDGGGNGSARARRPVADDADEAGDLAAASFRVHPKAEARRESEEGV